METYYHDKRAEDLFGSLDIWCRSFPLPAWGKERVAKGDHFWKVNAKPDPMEREPWVSARKRYIGLWDNYCSGAYIWTIKSWLRVKEWGVDYWCDAGVGNLNQQAGNVLSTLNTLFPAKK